MRTIVGTTDLLTFPRDLTDASWLKRDVTISANSTFAPDTPSNTDVGSRTADRVVETATTADHSVQRSLTGLLSDNMRQRSSAYFKLDQRTFAYIWTRSKTGGSGDNFTFLNLSTGAITRQDAGHTNVLVEACRHGWFRLSVEWDSSSGGTAPFVIFGMATGDGSSGGHITYLGNTANGLYIWGADHITGEAIDILGPRVAHDIRVEVQDGDSRYHDWSDLVVGATWGETRDQPVSQANIRLRRQSVGPNNWTTVESIAPLYGTSGLNLLAAGTYSPAIDKGRRVRISTACIVGGSVGGGIPFSSRGRVWTHSGISSFTADRVSDGKYSFTGAQGAWHTDSAVAGAYLQVDMGGLVFFRRARIYSTGTYAGVYKVRASLDGAAWVDVATGFAPATRGWHEITWTPSQARYWRLELTNTPGGGSWLDEGEFDNYVRMWEGRVDNISWEGDPIVITCSDEGAWLMDTQIETETQYGTGGGEAVQTSMQNILNGWPSGKGVPTLFTPVSPAWNIKTYTQERNKVLEGIRNLALQIGWDLRFRFDSSHVYRLTFYDPDRDSTTVHATLGPTHYSDVRKLHMSIEDIRNAGKVTFLKADGTVGTATSTDAPSITKHGRRYIELPAAENIDTQTEADAYIAAVVNDLSDTGAEQEIDMLYFWPVQLHDRIKFRANGTHYTDDQTWAVVGYTHSFEQGVARTTIQVAGRIVGAYNTWLQRGGTDDSESLITCPAISLTQAAHGTIAANAFRTHRVLIGFTKPLSANYDRMEFSITSNSPGESAATQLSAIDPPAAFINAHPGLQYTVTPTVILKSGRRVTGTAQAITITGSIYIGPTRIILPVGADLWAT